jgi:hypothetical protein
VDYQRLNAETGIANIKRSLDTFDDDFPMSAQLLFMEFDPLKAFGLFACKIKTANKLLHVQNSLLIAMLISAPNICRQSHTRSMTTHRTIYIALLPYSQHSLYFTHGFIFN